MKRLRNEAVVLSEGILAGNLLRIGSQPQLLDEAGAMLAYIDVMDRIYFLRMTAGRRCVPGTWTIKDWKNITASTTC